MATKKMTISMPQELYDRMARFPVTNWSRVARDEGIETKLRILEAIADSDRIAALREKAKADCSDLKAAGLEDAVSYPIEDIDYRFLREFEERAQTYIENSDPENLIAMFDQLNPSFHGNGNPAFRLRFQALEYKLGFIDGIMRIKRIADGLDISDRLVSTTKSLFEFDGKTMSAD